MEDSAVLDAPVDVEPVADTPEAAAEPSSPAEPSEPTSETPEETPKDPPATETKGLTEQDKATLAKIQAENPALAGRLRRALFAEQQFKAVAPGGLKEVREMRQTIEQIGGAEGLQRIQAERSEWEALDRQFTAGDPAFIKGLAESSPESFAKLAPVVFEQYQKMNPDGYAAHVTQVFMADMQASNIPLAMARLEDVIGDNPKAKHLLDHLNGYFGRIKTLSEKQASAPAAKEPNNDLDKQKQEFEQQREQFTRNEWKSGASRELNQVYSATLSELLKGRNITNEQRASILELTQLRLQRKWDADGGLRSQLDKLFANKDRAGYDRIAASHYKQDVPEVLRQVCKHILPGKPGPAAAAKPAAVAGTPKPATATADGYARVAAPPATHEIDYKYTTAGLYAQGKAVLKSGKRVQWK